MSGFDAGSAVSALDWDFTKYAGKSAKGTIAEPSTADIKSFLSAVGDSVILSGDADKLKEMSGEEVEAENERFFSAVVELCGGKPTRAQIDKLPHRVKRAFAGWVWGIVTNPT